MGNKLDERFGMALKTIRESRAKTQEDFAKIGRSYLSELERGLKTPTLETIVILAEELGVTPTYLVALATGPEPPATTVTTPHQLADILSRAYHLAANSEREVAGPAMFTADNSLGEVNEIARSGKVELGRLLADAALLSFRDNRDSQPRTRRANLEFITANKREIADLKYADDPVQPDDWWLRPDEALDALKAANRTIELIDDLSRMNEIPIFRLLGMRNLSSFIGAVYAHSLFQLLGDRFILNPHQDGYPDLCARTSEGQRYIDQIAGRHLDTAKESFTHYRFGGIEVKATCGNTPPPAEGRPKPQIGESRTHLVQSADWKAHHRSTNNLLGLYWDFLDGMPTIVALFYSNALVEDDWGKIVMPKIVEVPPEGELEEPRRVGRTTSVSVMKPKGVKKMGKGWVVLPSDEVLMKGLAKKTLFDLKQEDVARKTDSASVVVDSALAEVAASQQIGRRRGNKLIDTPPKQRRKRKPE